MTLPTTWLAQRERADEIERKARALVDVLGKDTVLPTAATALVADLRRTFGMEADEEGESGVLIW